MHYYSNLMLCRVPCRRLPAPAMIVHSKLNALAPISGRAIRPTIAPAHTPHPPAVSLH